jgi:hypothetical protein
MSDYLKENMSEEGGGGGEKEEKVLVCEANPHNITLIFNQLMAFIQEIERALKCQPGTHCTLYAFLMDYIKVGHAVHTQVTFIFFTGTGYRY